MFQQTFSQEEDDSILLSALFLSVYAITRSFDAEIETVRFKQLIYYFKSVSNLVFVVGTSETLKYDDIEKITLALDSNPKFQQIVFKAKQNQNLVLDNPEIYEIQAMLFETLKSLNLSPDQALRIRVSTLDELLSISDIVKDLNDGRSSPKELAEKIFGEGLEKRDPEVIKKYISQIDDFMHSTKLSKKLKKQLGDLNNYLKRTIRFSKLFGF